MDQNEQTLEDNKVNLERLADKVVEDMLKVQCAVQEDKL